MLPRSVLISALTLCVRLTAQVAVDHWTTDNGLPLNSVGAMCQTPDGYLWLATPDGLARFDGVAFTNFDKSNTKAIQGNRFRGMYCSPDGGFWAATESSGVVRYDHGRFRSYQVRDGLPSDSINALTGDADGNVWVLALGTVSRWDRSSDRFVTLDRADYRYDRELGAGAQGFFGIEGGEMRLFIRGKKSAYHLPARLDETATTYMGFNVNEQIWLASRGEVFRLADGQWSSPSGPRGHPARVISDYHDSRGRTWQIENDWAADGRFVQYMLLPDSTPSKVSLQSVFEDSEGGLWLGTDGQGLYRLRDRMIQVTSREQGLPDGNIYTILQARDGAIWIGTWSGGLARLLNGRFTTYSTAQGLASGRVFSIAEDSEGRLWVAVEGGLYRATNNRFEKIEVTALRSGDQTIRAIYSDPTGVMWFGTNQGLLRFAQGTWKVLTMADGLAGDDVRVIIPARNGGFWVAGYGGLSRLNNGEVRAWTQNNGLPANTVRSLYEDGDGVLWIGTYDGGLGRFADGHFTRYTRSEGLFNNGVFQILEDSRGNLWMSSNRGIYRVLKRELNDFAAGKIGSISSIAYGREDGLRNIECNGGLWPAGMRARDGTLWFPTQDGAAVIDPEKLPSTPKPPPVIIESCMIDHKPVAEHPVRVAPGYGNLEIQYTAPSFVNSEHIHFRYQLVGLDKGWLAAGTRRTAYYPHLPPGTYTFRVTAANSDGAWNTVAADLPIVVLPAFYQTWWFESILLVAAIAAISIAWRYRIQQLQRDHAARQAFSRQLIASQENERKRIAGELHDSLGQRLVVIKNRALLLLQRRESSGALFDEQVQAISAEVSEAVREVKEISYDLRPYRLDRLGLTTALQGMIETAANSSGIHMATEIDDVDAVLPGQTEINFYRIVQECVNNILRHSHATKASIRIKRSTERLQLVVNDNGCGFTPGAGHQGFGLAGIRERTQLLAGKLDLQSAPGQGTTITIVIDLLSI